MQELGSRIRIAADRIGGLDKLAPSLTGVKRRTLTDYVANKSEPRISTILEIATITSVRLDWLLTGQGNPDDADQLEPVSQINAELMERLHDRVASIFHDVDQKPPQRRIAREAANLYNELAKVVQDMSDQEMVEAALPMVALEFKRRLERAAEEPGTGKRSAS